uniref:Uncharacterized protein n=1 Tax=Romanomermis culicivorax TaxID=13658 RepID=A0A915HI89_ROMCU
MKTKLLKCFLMSSLVIKVSYFELPYFNKRQAVKDLKQRFSRENVQLLKRKSAATENNDKNTLLMKKHKIEENLSLKITELKLKEKMSKLEAIVNKNFDVDIDLDNPTTSAHRVEKYLVSQLEQRNKEYEEKCRDCMDLDQKLTEAGQTYEKNQAEINETKVAIERL